MSKDILALAQSMTGFEGSKDPVVALSLGGKRDAKTCQADIAALSNDVSDPKSFRGRLFIPVGGLFFNVSVLFGNVDALFGNVAGLFANVAALFGNILGLFGNVSHLSVFTNPCQPAI